MPELLPPSDDRVFKLLLTHGDAGPVLKDIIAAIIGRKVRNVFLRNNEIPAEGILEKQERLDVNCVTDDGEQIDLEMQASRIEEAGDIRHVNLKRKSLFYLCDLHSSQSMKGKSYSELAKTWQVTFCAYNVFPGDKNFFRAATMRDKDGEVLADDITMAFVELPKAADLAKRPVDELTPLEMWTLFFGYAHRPKYRKVIDAIFKKKKEVDMAGTLLKSISKDERERAVLRSRRMFQTDMESNRITVERRGEKRGEKRGKKLGIAIGEILREADRKETARVLKSKGLPIDIIVEATKLTPDEIENLDRPQGKSRNEVRNPLKRRE
ncbi:MAG: Rpn family recombination-promoting nuclease/putative transposase [Acidobacteriota bacterium]|nr:Rpn family recombination-promoting nuclease/putative transposase [Acidobacteriota bacterium]